MKIIHCIVKVESRECEILKTAFKTSHDVMSASGGVGGRKELTSQYINFYTNNLDVPPNIFTCLSSMISKKNDSLSTDSLVVLG